MAGKNPDIKKIYIFFVIKFFERSRCFGGTIIKKFCPRKFFIPFVNSLRPVNIFHEFSYRFDRANTFCVESMYSLSFGCFFVVKKLYGFDLVGRNYEFYRNPDPTGRNWEGRGGGSTEHQQIIEKWVIFRYEIYVSGHQEGFNFLRRLKKNQRISANLHRDFSNGC